MSNEELYCLHNRDYERLLSEDGAFARAIRAYEAKDYIAARMEIESIEEPDAFVLLFTVKIYHHFFHVEKEILDKCVAIVKNLLSLDADYDFKVYLARVLKECGFYDDADKLFTELLELTPFENELWFDYGMMWDYIDDEKAIDILQRAYYHFLDYKESLLGVKRVSDGDIGGYNFQERLQGSRSMKNLDDLDVFIYEKLVLEVALLYFRSFRYEDALNLFKEAKFYNYKNAYYFSLYAQVLEYTGFYEEARDAYERALFLKADQGDYFAYGKFLLRLGDERGFEFYESRLNWAFDVSFSEKYYHYAYREFYRNKLFLKDKKVLVYCEQGFGDTIMFGRILTKLCNIAKEVIFCPQKQLITLFDTHVKKMKTQNKTYKNLKISENVVREFDYAVPICSLFLFLNLTDPKSISKMPTPLIPIKNKNHNKKKKVGIFFYTPNAISHKSLFWRNMDLQWLLDVLAPFEVEIINFTHQGEHEFPDYVRDLSAQLVDWLDTSLALEELDLLISIDSAIAHLGLALEVPTLVVLGQRFEWRWGRVEQPESFFWPRAHIFVIKDADQDKSAMSSLVADILKIKHT